MDRFDRIYLVHRQLQGARVGVSHARLEALLECSRATVNRVLHDMREYFHAPIVVDRERGGYRYEASAGEPQFELPGLWFNADETFALLACQQLLDSIQPGLLGKEIEPFRQKLEQLLKGKHGGRGELAPRVRILGISRRVPAPELFGPLGAALTRRQRLDLTYAARGSGEVTRRVISPQRLVRYRDNWYLDGWDHAKAALRVFSVDRIQQLLLLEEPALDLPDTALDAVMASGYGIFSGVPDAIAVLCFSPTRARWVADEQWHPAQVACWRPDGRYELRVPYGNPTELLMDVLKHGPDCEVIEPAELRQAVRTLLADALRQYPVAG